MHWGGKWTNKIKYSTSLTKHNYKTIKVALIPISNLYRSKALGPSSTRAGALIDRCQFLITCRVYGNVIY